MATTKRTQRLVVWALWGLTLVLAGSSSEVVAQDKLRHSPTGERFGWVRVYTTGDALVTVDGKPYPKRSEYGLKVSAGKRHEVVVSLGEKKKTYAILVRPKEMRTLLVDLTGYQSPPSAAPAVSGGAVPTNFKPPAPAGADAKSDEEEEERGKLTVYSKPKGEVFVDGTPLGATTPMINRELDLGRHEVQVRWENGEMSEVKTIRIRKGSKLKLFFRDRSNNTK